MLLINTDKIFGVSHQVIVKAKKTMIDEISHGALKLKYDTSFDPYKNMVICAEVVSGPSRLNSVLLYTEDTGMTADTSKLDNYITVKEQKIEVRPGDKIYFHYLGLHDNNYLGKDRKGNSIYMIPYDTIFCIVRKKKICMINGYVLVEPFFGKDYQDIAIPEYNSFMKPIGTRTIKVKMNDDGLVLDIGEKPKYRQGTIKHIGAHIKNDFKLKAGDKVIFGDGCEFKNTIEGKEYNVMKQWDVLATIKDNKVVPCGMTVMVDPFPVPKASKIILLDTSMLKPQENEGIVVGVGNLVPPDVELGDKVRFRKDNFFTLKMEEFNCIFMHYNYLDFKYV